MKIQSNRIEWVDISKGIGILLVIIGHCVFLGGAIHNWIFSFHMPLFFILSGLFLKRANLLPFIKKKVHSLLYPYILFCTVGFVFTISFPVTRSELTLRGILSDIYFADPENINISSIWFLVCLFLSSTLLQVVFKVHKKKVQICIVIVLAFVGFVFAKYRTIFYFLPRNRLPLNIDVSMIAILFISLGYYLQEKIFNIVDFLEKLPALRCCIVFIALLIISNIIATINGRVNVHGLIFNNVTIFIVAAIIGSSTIICLSVLIVKTKILKECFKWLGRESIVILGLQSLMIRIYIIVADYICNQTFTLYYLRGIHVWLSTIFVLTLSVLIALLFEKCRYLLDKQVRSDKPYSIKKE